MNKMFLISLLYLVTSLSSPAQSHKIIKAIDNNLFILDNNRKVQLAFLETPSIHEKDEKTIPLAKEVYDWINELIVGRTFEISFISMNSDSIYQCKAMRSYLLGEENLIKWYARLGYGIFTGDNKSTSTESIYHSQELARKNNLGLWKLIRSDLTIQNSYLDEETKRKQKIENLNVSYTKPNLPLLGISLLSLVISWDSFASASELGDNINYINENDRDADTSNLKTAKTRKTIIGIAGIACAIFTTVYAFKSVEVKTDLSSLSISYRF